MSIGNGDFEPAFESNGITHLQNILSNLGN